MYPLLQKLAADNAENMFAEGMNPAMLAQANGDDEEESYQEDPTEEEMMAAQQGQQGTEVDMAIADTIRTLASAVVKNKDKDAAGLLRDIITVTKQAEIASLTGPPQGQMA